ncbi:unnamed protein product [Cylindrotheca closterium]|uniref:Uncharacterized protein n=1 Tax=Cylindrotheca closterium TaxID=2856 RepID=A0AAD2CHW3_9STRA|nr:unnamed protein product [Cylindrotheca closterium]
MSDSDSSQRLSDVQERFLALLPIPASILSITGSSIIIYIALNSRTRKKLSPYTRLLIGLSISDIVASINVAFASFLRPTESPRATSFAIGNATTCSVSGFMTTVAFSSALYSCMLSYYFLLTVRFRLKNSFIARRIEPLMHCISLGYPLISAIIGAYYDAYADTATYLGCWINCPAEKDEEECFSKTLGWIFYGWPFLFVVVSLIVNNILIWRLVHGHSVTLGRKSTRDGVAVSSDQSAAVNSVDDDSFLDQGTGVDDTYCGSNTTSPLSDVVNKAQKQTSDASADNQLRRLQLVKSQAFLFVGSYAFVTMWGGITAIGENRADSEDEELSLLVKLYPIMVLNAILTPMQGFFNMSVYVRPKYLTVRHEFKDKSRWWSMQRAILGEKKARASKTPRIPNKKPQGVKEASNVESPNDGLRIDDSAESADTVAQSLPLKRCGVSTLTASRGDFNNEEFCFEGLNDVDQDRWRCKRHDTWAPMKQAPRYYSSLQERGSSLEMISELTETQFEPIIDYSEEVEVEGDHRFRTPNRDSVPAAPRSATIPSPFATDSRWNPNSPKQRKLVPSLDLMLPQRVSSSSEQFCTQEDQLADEQWIDSQLQTSPRTRSLEKHSEIEDEKADVLVQASLLSSSARSAPTSEASFLDRMLQPPERRMSPPPL